MKIKKDILILIKILYLFFGSGKSIVIDKNDLDNTKFNFRNLENNLNELNLFDQKLDWTGIKDIK